MFLPIYVCKHRYMDNWYVGPKRNHYMPSIDYVVEGSQCNSSSKSPTMQEDVITATHYTTLVDSKN